MSNMVKKSSLALVPENLKIIKNKGLPQSNMKNPIKIVFKSHFIELFLKNIFKIL